MDTNSKSKFYFKGINFFKWIFMNDFYLYFKEIFTHRDKLSTGDHSYFNLNNKTIPVPNRSPVCLILLENFGALL